MLLVCLRCYHVICMLGDNKDILNLNLNRSTFSDHKRTQKVAPCMWWICQWILCGIQCKKKQTVCMNIPRKPRKQRYICIPHRGHMIMEQSCQTSHPCDDYDVQVKRGPFYGFIDILSAKFKLIDWAPLLWHFWQVQTCSSNSNHAHKYTHVYMRKIISRDKTVICTLKSGEIANKIK